MVQPGAAYRLVPVLSPVNDKYCDDISLSFILCICHDNKVFIDFIHALSAWDLQLLKKALAQLFPVNFANFLRTPFYRTSLVAASAYWISEMYLGSCQTYIMYRSSRPEVFCKKGSLKNLAKFTGKYTCARVSFLIKLHASGMQLY